MKFKKMTGAGNDFLLFDAIDSGAESFNDLDSLARRLCNRHFGPGADGLVILHASPDASADFCWDFLNADGSQAEMCGNAARCVGRYLLDKYSEKKEFRLTTAAGILRISKDLENESWIVVDMTPIKNSLWDQNFDWAGKSYGFDYVDSGVPHAVLMTQSLTAETLESLRGVAHEIRHHRRFQPQGTNVTFFTVNSETEIRSVSYERGVESFTLACGTGAVAAAVAYAQHMAVQEEKTIQFVKVIVPGGELRVDLQNAKPRMAGPAQYVGDFILDEEFYVR